MYNTIHPKSRLLKVLVVENHSVSTISSYMLQLQLQNYIVLYNFAFLV